MRHETWMECDERGPYEKKVQRIRSLRHQIADLESRLALLKADLEKVIAD